MVQLSVCMLSEDTFLMDQVCGMAEVFARSMRIAAMMILSYSFQRSWMLYISPELARIIGRMILRIRVKEIPTLNFERSSRNFENNF